MKKTIKKRRSGNVVRQKKHYHVDRVVGQYSLEPSDFVAEAAAIEYVKVVVSAIREYNSQVVPMMRRDFGLLAKVTGLSKVYLRDLLRRYPALHLYCMETLTNAGPPQDVNRLITHGMIAQYRAACPNTNLYASGYMGWVYLHNRGWRSRRAMAKKLGINPRHIDSFYLHTFRMYADLAFRDVARRSAFSKAAYNSERGFMFMPCLGIDTLFMPLTVSTLPEHPAHQPFMGAFFDPFEGKVIKRVDGCEDFNYDGTISQVYKKETTHDRSSEEDD